MTSMTRVRAHLVVTLLGVTLLCGSSAFAMPAHEDAITTGVVYDKGTTRGIALRPFRPATELAATMPELPEPNRTIVSTMLEYPRDGTHDYWWPRGAQASAYDGATTDVFVGHSLVLRGETRARSEERRVG